MRLPARFILTTLALAGAAAAQAQAPTPKAAAPAAPARATTPATPAAPAAKIDGEKEQAGRMAAQAWLQLLDRRDWGTAWDASSPIFRSIVPLGSWMDTIPKVREALGRPVERQSLDASHTTQLQNHPPGDYVNVTFESKFEKKTLNEVVTTMLGNDGRWRVTGYTFNER